MNVIPLPLSTEIVRDPEQLRNHLRDQRAATGAQEFEASLFGSVLEKMEKSLSIEDEQHNDAGHDTWSALGVQAIARCLAQRHVLGIADMIQRSLGLPGINNAPILKVRPATNPETK